MARKAEKKNGTRVATDPPRDVRRRTSHGIVCECGSKNVRIVNTRSRAYPPYLNRLVKRVRRQCMCRDCGRTWWRPTKVTEEPEGQRDRGTARRRDGGIGD